MARDIGNAYITILNSKLVKDKESQEVYLTGEVKGRKTKYLIRYTKRGCPYIKTSGQIFHLSDLTRI